MPFFLNENVWLGSDNGLATTGLQAIILTNDGKITDTYMLHSALMSLDLNECYIIS